jgi:hypothetical protein
MSKKKQTPTKRVVAYDLAFVNITLKDLADSRLDNKDLRSKQADLESSLRKCLEERANVKRSSVLP